MSCLFSCILHSSSTICVNITEDCVMFMRFSGKSCIANLTNIKIVYLGQEIEFDIIEVETWYAPNYNNTTNTPNYAKCFLVLQAYFHKYKVPMTANIIEQEFEKIFNRLYELRVTSAYGFRWRHWNNMYIIVMHWVKTLLTVAESTQ